MSHTRSFVQLMARILIATIFLWSGAQKILAWDKTLLFMQSHQMQMTQVFLAGAIFIEIIGGLCILLGWKLRIAALILALYLVPVTYVFHNFWAISEPMVKGMQLIQFLKNLAIIGGLLMLSLTPHGKYSIDKE